MTIKLCKLVRLSPVPLLVGEALFSNLGGTATMIGDPPNILIGNMLADYLNFNAFLLNLAPGVLLSAPAVFWCAPWRARGRVEGGRPGDRETGRGRPAVGARRVLVRAVEGERESGGRERGRD